MTYHLPSPSAMRKDQTECSWSLRHEPFVTLGRGYTSRSLLDCFFLCQYHTKISGIVNDALHQFISNDSSKWGDLSHSFSFRVLSEEKKSESTLPFLAKILIRGVQISVVSIVRFFPGCIQGNISRTRVNCLFPKKKLPIVLNFYLIRYLEQNYCINIIHIDIFPSI